MPILWKLLIALLIVAMPPLLIISYIDGKAAKGLATDLIATHEEANTEFVSRAMLIVTESNALAIADALNGPSAAPPAEAAQRAVERIGRQFADYRNVQAIVVHLGPAATPLAARDPRTAQDLIDALPPPLRDGSMADKPGVHRFTVDGVDSLSAVAPIDGTGLALILAAPVDLFAGTPVMEAGKGIDDRIQQQMFASGVGVFFLLIAAVVLSFIIARSITRPVKDLTATARRIADGDLTARCRIETGDELEDLGDSFNEMLPKLNDRIRMREALGLAMEVQQKLLPNAAPQIEGLDIAGRSIYCDETGGDYYDFLDLSELDGHKVGVAIGDVTGHGIAAALLMATARALLRAQATVPGSLSETISKVNRHLSGDAHAGRFMTLFYGVFNAGTKHLQWVNAGHAPALVLDPDSRDFSELEGGDIPLGIDGGWMYQEDTWSTWKPGTIIAIGTDGIWEMRDPDGVMFGQDALKALIRDHADRSSAAICNAVAEALKTHQAGREQEDDVTLVIVKLI